MTPTRAALEAAKDLISERRGEDFESFTIARDPATMDWAESAIIAEQDSVLALIEAALSAPDAMSDLLAAAKAMVDAHDRKRATGYVHFCAEDGPIIEQIRAALTAALAARGGGR